MLLEQTIETPVAQDEFAIMIVGDVRLYRDGIAASLAERTDLFALRYSATGCADAAAQLARIAPQIVILDMSSRDSLEFIRVAAATSARVIAVAVEETEADILRCAEAGAAGYVPRNASSDDLIQTMLCVTRGELLCSPRIAASLFKALRAQRARPASERIDVLLTARERQIAPLLDRGMSNKEIASALQIEVATVKNHVHNLLEKLQVASRGEAAARLRAASGAVLGRRWSDTRSNM
jgi:two-component system, NarL family, nitrate/nitrite response regulator NarL